MAPRRRAPSVRRTVLDLDRILRRTGTPYAIVGGVAANVWGRPRATHDVDAAILVPQLEGARRVLEEARRRGFRSNRGPRKALEVGFLTLRRGGDRADLALAQFKYDAEVVGRARSVPAFGRRLRVATPEDTILLKALSERPIDRSDAEGILRRREVDRGYLRSQARRFGPSTSAWVESLLGARRRKRGRR